MRKNDGNRPVEKRQVTKYEIRNSSPAKRRRMAAHDRDIGQECRNFPNWGS